MELIDKELRIIKDALKSHLGQTLSDHTTKEVNELYAKIDGHLTKSSVKLMFMEIISKHSNCDMNQGNEPYCTVHNFEEYCKVWAECPQFDLVDANTLFGTMSSATKKDMLVMLFQEDTGWTTESTFFFLTRNMLIVSHKGDLEFISLKRETDVMSFFAALDMVDWD